MIKDKSASRKDLEQYDVYNSPFLELQTPFTKWYGPTTCCLKAKGDNWDKKSVARRWRLRRTGILIVPCLD
jgi:hypothetical protein